MITICAPDVTTTPSQLVQGSIDLVSLPDIVFQVNEMMHDPGTSSKDLGEVIANDPGLSARLLKIVNSSFYGFQTRIDTLGRAITVIGVEDLHGLVLATSAVDTFNRIPQDLVDMTDFWIRSINCGIVARLLAKKINILHSERLFTAGLLHNLGSLLMYSKMPDASREVLLAANGNHRLIPGLEAEIFGFTNADVGGELTEHWCLPASLTEAIRYHLDPLQADGNALDASLIYLGNLFFNYGKDGGSFDDAVKEVPDEVFDLIRMDSEQLLSEVYQVPEHFAEIISVILPKTKVCY